MKHLTACMWNRQIKQIDPRCYVLRVGERSNGEGDYAVMCPSFGVDEKALTSPQSCRKEYERRNGKPWYVPDREMVKI